MPLRNVSEVKVNDYCVEFLLAEQKVVRTSVTYTHRLFEGGGFLILHRVMFEVLSRLLQVTKRWVTRFTVHQRRGASKNPRSLQVGIGTEQNCCILVNVVQGRIVKLVCY